MISYDPLWRTLRLRNISTYKLVKYYDFSTNTIYRLRHNMGISTAMIDRLCSLLDCKIEDVLLYIPDKDHMV